MQITLFLITPVVALIASWLVIAVIRSLDVLEREPWWAIGLSFVVGLITVIPAIVVLGFATLIWKAVLGEAAPVEMLQVMVDAPLIEEAMKGIGLLVVLLLIRRQIDSLTDYVVYACVVAIAFEFCENILYLWGRLAVPDGAALAWFAEFNARTVASAGMHAIFSAWIGFSLWCLIELRGSVRWLGGLAGAGLAVGLHALNNSGVYLSGMGDASTVSVINQVGLSVVVLGNILEMALFLGLIGSAILQDLHLLADYGLALQPLLMTVSADQRQSAITRLHACLNPFHHLVAHSRFTWRLTPLATQAPVARGEYARFAKAALRYGKEHGNNRTEQLAVGMGLLVPDSLAGSPC